MVPYNASADYPVPPMQVSSYLAHAGGLQWPTLLGTATTVANLCKVPAHSRQPPTPQGYHNKVAGSLCSLLQGAIRSLAGHPASSATQLPPPCCQGLGCHPGCGTPLG